MADDIAEQIKPHIHEILRIFKYKTLGELNKLMAQTSKLELQSTTNVHAKLIMVQNFDIETGQEETSSLPIHVQYRPLRRSDRLSPEKRTYENMQAPNTRTSRLAKDRSLQMMNVLLVLYPRIMPLIALQAKLPPDRLANTPTSSPPNPSPSTPGQH
jgi:hypothetical protein